MMSNGLGMLKSHDIGCFFPGILVARFLGIVREPGDGATMRHRVPGDRRKVSDLKFHSMMFSFCMSPVPKKFYNRRWFDLDFMRAYESMPE